MRKLEIETFSGFEALNEDVKIATTQMLHLMGKHKISDIIDSLESIDEDWDDVDGIRLSNTVITIKDIFLLKEVEQLIEKLTKWQSKGYSHVNCSGYKWEPSKK